MTQFSKPNHPLVQHNEQQVGLAFRSDTEDKLPPVPEPSVPIGHTGKRDASISSFVRLDYPIINKKI